MADEEVDECVESADASNSRRASDDGEISGRAGTVRGAKTAVWDCEGMCLTRAMEIMRCVPSDGTEMADVVRLDCSYNLLDSLEGIADNFTSLQRINIAYNRIPSLDTVVCALRHCHNLRALEMFQCGAWANEVEKYSNELFEKLPALEEVDGVHNPHPLGEKEWSSARSLWRLTGCGPNELYSLDLNDKNIDSDDIILILRALSHLPIKHLKLKNNVGSNMRGYRFFVINTLPTLAALDGQRITKDERSNAKREIDGMMQQATELRHRLDNRIQQTPNDPAKAALTITRSVPKNLSPRPDICDSNPNGTTTSPSRLSSTVKRRRPSSSSRDEITGASPDSPSGFFSATSTMPATSIRESAFVQGGRLRKRLSEVASKGLQDDILQFGESASGRVLADNAKDPNILRALEAPPLTVISGRMGAKFEILVSYLQIYTLLYRLGVQWPQLWQDINDPGNWLSWLVSGFPSIDFTFLAPNGASLAVSQMIFILFMSLPLIFLIFYNSEYIRRHGMTLIRVLVRRLRRVEEPTDAITTKKIRQQQRESKFARILFAFTGFTPTQLRKRIALVGTTITYVAVSRATVMTFTYELDEEGEKDMKNFPGSPWPDTIFEFVAKYHWPLVVAAVALPVYVLGIPTLFALLVRTGVQEATQNYDLPEIEEELHAAETLLRKGSTSTLYKAELQEFVENRRKAAKLLYARAVREYRLPQGYLFFDYRRGMKYYKVAVLTIKVLLIVAVICVGETGAGPAPLTTAGSLATGITAAHFILAVGYRPYQASSELLMEGAMTAANLSNAIIGLVIGAVQEYGTPSQLQSVSGEATGILLIVINAAALCWLLGVALATPFMFCMARRRNEEMAKLSMDVQLELREAELYTKHHKADERCASAPLSSRHLLGYAVSPVPFLCPTSPERPPPYNV